MAQLGESVEAVTEFGVFDFGLSQEQEERAARLHAEAIIVDLLFQGPCGYLAYDDEVQALVAERREGLDPTGDFGGAWVAASYAAPMRAALRGHQAFRAHWEESGVVGGNRQLGFDVTDLQPWAAAQVQFDSFPWLVRGLRAEDFRQAKANGQRVGYISTQNSDGLDHELKNLQLVYDLGLRVLGLTYNMQNVVGGGCTERTDTGVSNFGARVIERANELGIIVDTAHSSRQTTLDACELSEQPVIASHTTANAVFAHERAKGDEQLEAIARTGGVIGINAGPVLPRHRRRVRRGGDDREHVRPRRLRRQARRLGARRDRHRLAAPTGQGLARAHDEALGTDRLPPRAQRQTPPT